MAKKFSGILLKWYDKHKRDLPWRQTKDPYRIWLSEVMLQQTQVDTGTPYYNKWLKRFPTVESVANASQDEILKYWEGLGYYARARNFHKACQFLISSKKGKKALVPDSPDSFSDLPGVGPYITAAVQSIAFGHVIPAVDGNIKRIVSRLKRLKKVPSQSMSEIETFLKSEISRKRPGDFNQALMDLGATICRPKDPLCLLCPVSSFCEAYQEGDVRRFPILEAQKKRPHFEIAIGVVWKGNEVLIGQRKNEGLLGGLWEFPGGKIKPGETSEDCVRREIKEEVNVTVDHVLPVGKIKHAYTHFSIQVEGFVCRYKKGIAKPIECEQVKWISFGDISKFAFPKANHKLFPLLPETNPWNLK